MYDLIGDIHGHADALKRLLDKLGYSLRGDHYQHSERKVIFVGDFIDRGKQIKETLNIVRSMVDNGAALSVMGNHEYNAIMYHTPDPKNPGNYLREHSKKNQSQHQATLDQLDKQELKEYIEWFKTLPFWLDLEELRVVHACWDKKSLNIISDPCSLVNIKDCNHFLSVASKKDTKLFQAIEDILKGKEISLPQNLTFKDKDGNNRKKIRIKWFKLLRNKTYAEAALPPMEDLPNVKIPNDLAKNHQPYPKDSKPVFVGHYWMSDSNPSKLDDNIACLDYSVAKKGFLCAYRWNGEKKLKNHNFVAQ